MSSLVHLILWVTMAMVGASIVLYVKTNLIEGETDDQKDQDGNDHTTQTDVVVKEEIQTNEKAHETIKSSPSSSPCVPVENIVMYIFACTGALMAIFSWVVEQKRDVSYVGLSLLLSLMLCCLGLGGIAGILAEMYLPREHLLGLTKAVCALTGLVVIGILSLIRGGM